MSLKAFHIVFVSIAVLVCSFTGAWGLWASQAENDSRFLLMAFFGFLGAIWLGYYGVRADSKLFGQRGHHA